MKISAKILTAVLAAGLSMGATGAAFADGDDYHTTTNFSSYQKPAPFAVKKQRKALPPGVRCEPGFYKVANCNVSRNGRFFGPESYEYASETGYHIQR